MNKQPEALRLAEKMESYSLRSGYAWHCHKAAAELRRLHELLTTTPPQRTWVGLAAEDRLTAKYMQDAPDGIEAVIDYIDAKLKEKNT